MSYYALIMAGGTGTRLWPSSRYENPKQLLTLVGARSMFEHAIDRLSPLFAATDIFVVAREGLIAPLNGQVPALPAQNFIIEPQGRGTAPAIGLAAIHLQHRDPNAVMAVLTADHFIAKTEHFRHALAAAAALAEQGHLVTLGIKPDAASTGFGYIEQGAALVAQDDFPVFRVAQFAEKPDAETAAEMFASGRYAWNSGMFIWRVARILAEFERQMPRFYAQLMEIAAAIGTADYEAVLARVWPEVSKQSIDYGIMEGAKDVVGLPVDIGWSDVGSWGSLFDVLPVDAEGNVIVGPYLGIDTHGTLAFGGKRLIATLGVENLVIVDTDDAVLVCAKEREQDVRALVDALRVRGDVHWI